MKSVELTARRGWASRRANRHAGFSLVELIVVIGIIGMLVAMLMPTLARARRQALVVQCASNLRQIAGAMQMYLNDNHGMTFWLGKVPDNDGMEWFVYGGRETGNLDQQQAGIFNHTIPRPLNKYVSNQYAVFHCPEDVEGTAPWSYGDSAPSQFEWVGNSYHFNSNGEPGVFAGGLAGLPFTRIRDSSRTPLFLDAAFVWGLEALTYTAPWHPQHMGNVCFADSHVEFMERPTTAAGYHWGTTKP